MDNAGGHGTNEAKEEYTNILKEEFNIELEWQITNSPELSMLNLGAWMAVQLEIEEIHKNSTMQHDILVGSINVAFENIDDRILTNIHNRWIKVLNIIVVEGGENDYVEKYQGDTSSVIDMTDDNFHSSTHIQSVIDQCKSTDEEMEEMEKECVQGDMDEVMAEED